MASGQGAGEKHGRFISRNGSVGGGVDHDDGSYDWVKVVFFLSVSNEPCAIFRLGNCRVWMIINR